MSSIQLSGILWDISKYIITATAGAVIALCINYLKQKHDDEIQLKNNIYALFCKFFFISSIQYSELINKKKELEERHQKIQSFIISPQSLDHISIAQDFYYDENISISINDLSDALFKLRSMKSFQTGDPQSLQSFYLVNNKYYGIIKHFSRYHEMKRSIKQDNNFINSLIHYLKNDIPVTLDKIDAALRFIEQTQDSCNELFRKLGKPKPTAFGEITKL